MPVVFDDVHAYEARNNYWAGQVLKKVSGASLYLADHKERPWSLTVHCDAEGNPHCVEFENGTRWSFCSLSERMRSTEWPLFIKDYYHRRPGSEAKCKARVERLFTDSMHLTIKSENALLNDLLIWHYPPDSREK
jgi:hypothetical protein